MYHVQSTVVDWRSCFVICGRKLQQRIRVFSETQTRRATCKCKQEKGKHQVMCVATLHDASMSMQLQQRKHVHAHTTATQQSACHNNQGFRIMLIMICHHGCGVHLGVDASRRMLLVCGHLQLTCCSHGLASTFMLSAAHLR